MSWIYRVIVEEGTRGVCVRLVDDSGGLGDIVCRTATQLEAIRRAMQLCSMLIAGGDRVRLIVDQRKTCFLAGFYESGRIGCRFGLLWKMRTSDRMHFGAAANDRAVDCLARKRGGCVRRLALRPPGDSTPSGVHAAPADATGQCDPPDGMP